LAEGLGGGAEPGPGGFELIGEFGILLVGCGELLIGRGDMALQAVAPDQRAQPHNDGNNDDCDERPRGGPLGDDYWFRFTHLFSPWIRRRPLMERRCARMDREIVPRKAGTSRNEYSSGNAYGWARSPRNKARAAQAARGRGWREELARPAARPFAARGWLCRLADARKSPVAEAFRDKGFAAAL